MALTLTDLCLSPYERQAWILTASFGLLLLLAIAFMEFSDFRRKHFEEFLLHDGSTRARHQQQHRKKPLDVVDEMKIKKTTTTSFIEASNDQQSYNNSSNDSDSDNSTTTTNSNNDNIHINCRRGNNNSKSDSSSYNNNSSNNNNGNNMTAIDLGGLGASVQIDWDVAENVLKRYSDEFHCMYEVLGIGQMLESQKLDPDEFYQTLLDLEFFKGGSSKSVNMAEYVLHLVRELHGLEATDHLFGGTLISSSGDRRIIGDENPHLISAPQFFNLVDLEISMEQGNDDVRLVAAVEGVQFEDFFRGYNSKYRPDMPKTLPKEFDPILKEEERTKLEQFQKKLRPEAREDQNMDLHACLRFLRARKWDEDAAVAMAHDWFDWFYKPLDDPDNGKTLPANGGRADKEITPANILAKQYVDVNENIFADLCPHTNTAEDKEGSPIYWELTGQISSGFLEVMNQLSENHLLNRHIRQQEMMMEACRYQSIKHNKLIEKQAIVFNLANLDMSVNLTALNVFKNTLFIDQNYYPERLKYFVMINSPWFFNFIWSTIKPFIDVNTAQKFQIVGSDYLPTLQKFINDDQIPDFYGGKLVTKPRTVDNRCFWGHPYPTKCSNVCCGCGEEVMRKLNDRLYYSSVLDKDGGRSDARPDVETGKFALAFSFSPIGELLLNIRANHSGKSSGSSNDSNSAIDDDSYNSKSAILERAPAILFMRFDPTRAKELVSIVYKGNAAVNSHSQRVKYHLRAVFVRGDLSTKFSSITMYRSGDKWLRRVGSELCAIADPFVVMQAADFGVSGFKLREYRRGQSLPPHYDDTRPIEPNTATLVYEIVDKSN